MTELKEQLQSDVIDLLHNPEQAKALGLSLPNGLLFYGPPGCGKTFFAEKFAEELNNPNDNDTGVSVNAIAYTYPYGLLIWGNRTLRSYTSLHSHQQEGKDLFLYPVSPK